MDFKSRVKSRDLPACQLNQEEKKIYSVDIRSRIVWQKIAMDLSFRNISLNLNIAVAIIIYHLFKETGTVNPRTPKSREHIRKLDSYHENYIMCLIVNSPTLYLLSEIVQITNL